MGQDGNGLFVKNDRNRKNEPGLYRAYLLQDTSLGYPIGILEKTKGLRFHVSH